MVILLTIPENADECKNMHNEYIATQSTAKCANFTRAYFAWLRSDASRTTSRFCIP